MSMSIVAVSMMFAANVAAVEPPLAAQWARQPAAVAEKAETARPARKRCAHGKKRCRGRAAPEVDPRLVESEAIRRQVLEVAGPMAAGGRYVEAAGLLSGAAERRVDPVLYLAAAEAQLADPRADVRRLAAARGWAEAAGELAQRPVELRVAPEAAAELVEHGRQLAAVAGQRRAGLRLARRGRGQLIVGGVMAAVSLGGVGLVTGGAALAGRVDEAQRAYQGDDEAYRRGLAQAKDRAETMLAVGLVGALVGAAIGVPLTITGARDIRRARADSRERPSFRITPGLAGATLSGRF